MEIKQMTSKSLIIDFYVIDDKKGFDVVGCRPWNFRQKAFMRKGKREDLANPEIFVSIPESSLASLNEAVWEDSPDVIPDNPSVFVPASIRFHAETTGWKK